MHRGTLGIVFLYNKVSSVDVRFITGTRVGLIQFRIRASSADTGAHESRPKVIADTPPSFPAQAEDNPADDLRKTLVCFAALKQARVPTEMRIYPRGGHAFGWPRTKDPVTAWPQVV